MKKTNTLQSVWITFRSISITLWLSSATIFSSYFAPQRIDGIILSWARRLLKVVKLQYRVFNPHSVTLAPNKAYIIMSNHASLYDIPIIFAAIPDHRIRMIAKKELFRVPIWGRAMKVAGFINIDRENSAQALLDLEAAKQKMRDGVAIWVAPEGTRSRDGKLHTFKRGAFMLALQTEATIIPVGIRGAAKVLPAKTLEYGIGGEVEIHIGEPVDTGQYSKETRNALIKVVQERIAEAAAIEIA